MNLSEASQLTSPISVLDRRVSVKSKEGSVTITPRCWKTVYHLLDLYATKPHTKTITHRYFRLKLFY